MCGDFIANINEFFHAVSFSGGKDSTAMLLLMIERGCPIDSVFWADTGMEFPEMYDHVAKVDGILYRERGIHITSLRNPHGFEWLMFDAPLQSERALDKRITQGVSKYGYGWPGIHARWCTGYLKTHLITKEINRLKDKKNAINYIGIAADEAWRCKNDRYPLVEWGITEAMALQICYTRGLDWSGLYEKYHRCSCWCCPFQQIGELRNLRKYHPDLWKKLIQMDKKAYMLYGNSPLGRFRNDYSVMELERRFSREDQDRQHTKKSHEIMR